VNDSGPGGAPPGWYPDPWGAAAWRWWDGSGWTAYASSPPAPTPSTGQGPAGAYPYSGYSPVGPPPPSVHDRFAAEQRAVPWGKLAFSGYLLIVGLGLLTAWQEGSWLRHVFHIVRTQTTFGPGYTDFHQSAALTATIWVTIAAEAAVYVALLIWQYRAAKTAQLLRLPASLSPGLGVGGWFIPVVNFWFPYQAIRDCLPPGDDGRRVVFRMWMSFIAVLASDIITTVLALAGTAAAFAFAATTLVAGVSFAVHGARSVRLIAESHRRLVRPDRPDALGG
jgi:hypothetical protein